MRTMATRTKKRFSFSSFCRRVSVRAFALGRAAICAAVLLLGVAWFSARSARAELGEAALGVGRQLSGFEDLTGSTYRVRLNGEPINVATKLVEHPIAEVLARFENHCEKRSVATELADVDRALAESGAASGDPDKRGILRRESSREGFVACLVDTRSEGSLSARLERFTKTLDIADVGLLRYVYAKKTEGGRTHVVIAWTDGAFRLEHLLAGGSKDAPGTDVAGGARPVDSVRLLTAAVDNAPYSARIYQSRAAAPAVLGALDGEMKSKGWERLVGGGKDPENARAYSKEGRDVLTFVYPSETGSVVSMVEASAK